MNEYVKINTVWKRDERGKIIEGEYATPELAYLKDVAWEWTEKVDGTNIRLGWEFATGEVRVGGRTDNAQVPTKLLANIMPMDTRFAEVFPDSDVVLYGEGYGAGIQSGGFYRPDQSFILFDVLIDGFWLSRVNVEDVGQKMGLAVVPLVAIETLWDACELVKAGLQSGLANGVGEGLVGRPQVDLFDRRGDRIMAKIKARDYR